MPADVTVILPIYNTEKYLEQCLESVCSQTLRHLEIICVDDGSTDRSPQIMDSFAARDSRVTVVHKANGGYGSAVNVGLSRANGDYIAIVEPDDYVDVTMFEKLITCARQHGNPDIVKASYWRVIDADSPTERIEPAYYLHRVQHVDVRFTLDEDAEFLYHHPSIWTAIYRRPFLGEHDIKMHEIPGAGWADNPWLIETLVQARSIVYLDECLYFYREFAAGSSSNVRDPSIIYDRWFDMDDILKKLGVSAPRIIEGHYNRGCAYIDMLVKDFDENDPNIRQAIDRMMSLIDGNVVRTSKKIPWYYKEAYFRQADGSHCMLKHPSIALHHIRSRLR